MKSGSRKRTYRFTDLLVRFAPIINYRSSIAIALCALLFAACQTEAERTALDTQEVAIDNYITAQIAADTTRTLVVNDGSYRLVLQAGNGAAAAVGDSVYFWYVAYVFSNGKGMAFDTNLPDESLHPSENNGKGVLGVKHFIPGLDKGLQGMQLGEHAEIIFPATQGYGSDIVGLVPKLSALLFEVEIIKIVKQ